MKVWVMRSLVLNIKASRAEQIRNWYLSKKVFTRLVDMAKQAHAERDKDRMLELKMRFFVLDKCFGRLKQGYLAQLKRYDSASQLSCLNLQQSFFNRLFANA